MQSLIQSWISLVGGGGACPLQGIKEMYALSLTNRLVYIRFWTKKLKFEAEAAIKLFKAQNPRYHFVSSRPNLEKFPSAIRQSRDEIKAHIFKIYVNTLTLKGLAEYEPKYEAFKRAIFIDEKYVFEKGILKMWIEFTDPTNCTSILSYSFGNDPFSGFEKGNNTPNPHFRAKYPSAEYSISTRGAHVLNPYV